MLQIKANEVPKYTKMFLIKQKYVCPICKENLAQERKALDHDHDTGVLRSVLCNTCNKNEGKVKSAAKFMSKVTFLGRVNYILWLENLVAYLKHHKENPSKVLHHSFDKKLGKQKPKKRLLKRNKKTTGVK